LLIRRTGEIVGLNPPKRRWARHEISREPCTEYGQTSFCLQNGYTWHSLTQILGLRINSNLQYQRRRNGSFACERRRRRGRETEIEGKSEIVSTTWIFTPSRCWQSLTHSHAHFFLAHSLTQWTKRKNKVLLHCATLWWSSRCQ
jgi:hypothetical protein